MNAFPVTLFAASLIGMSTTFGALTAHFTLDETTGGTVADLSGNGNTGTVFGGDLSAAGIAGTGFGVPDFSSYIQTTSLFSGNAARTVSLWFNASTIDASQRRLGGVGSGAAQSFDITLETNTGGNSVGLRYGNGNLFWSGSSENGQDIQLNVWNHIVITYDGTILDGGVSLYLNGTLIGADGGNGNNIGQALNTTAGDFYLASGPGGIVPVAGAVVDDFQFYDTDLGAAEASYLFNNPGTSIPEPSIALLGGLGFLGLLRRRR